MDRGLCAITFPSPVMGSSPPIGQVTSRAVGKETEVQLASYFVYRNSNGTGHEKKAEELGCLLQTPTISPNPLQFYQDSKMVHPLLFSPLFADILLLINLFNTVSNLLVLSSETAVSQKFIACFPKRYFLLYI